MLLFIVVFFLFYFVLFVFYCTFVLVAFKHSAFILAYCAFTADHSVLAPDHCTFIFEPHTLPQPLHSHRTPLLQILDLCHHCCHCYHFQSMHTHPSHDTSTLCISSASTAHILQLSLIPITLAWLRTVIISVGRRWWAWLGSDPGKHNFATVQHFCKCTHQSHWSQFPMGVCMHTNWVQIIATHRFLTTFTAHYYFFSFTFVQAYASSENHSKDTQKYLVYYPLCPSSPVKTSSSLLSWAQMSSTDSLSSRRLREVQDCDHSKSLRLMRTS